MASRTRQRVHNRVHSAPGPVNSGIRAAFLVDRHQSFWQKIAFVNAGRLSNADPVNMGALTVPAGVIDATPPAGFCVEAVTPVAAAMLVAVALFVVSVASASVDEVKS